VHQLPEGRETCCVFFWWWDIIFFPGWELTELTPQEENEGMNKHNNEPMLHAKACQNWGSSPPWQVLPMYTPLDENSTLGQTKRIESMAVWIEILKQNVAIGFFVLPTYFCFTNSFLSSKFCCSFCKHTFFEATIFVPLFVSTAFVPGSRVC